LAESVIDQLFAAVAVFSGFELVIDLEQQQVRTVDGSAAYHFEVDAHRRWCLMNGFDDIGLTLRHADLIRAFEAQRLEEQPWLGRTLQT